MGETLAHILLEPIAFFGSCDESALQLATYALALAKDHVPGCGGMSLMLNLRHNGWVGEFYDQKTVEDAERIIKTFNLYSWQLLSSVLNSEVEDAHFEENLETVFRDLVLQHNNVRDRSRRRDKALKERNPTCDLSEAKKYAQYPIRDP